MNNIVFFDIDGTLFDPAKFLIDFRSKISSEFEEPKLMNVNLWDISSQVKDEGGYFIPSNFLEKVSTLSPKIDLQKLNDLFWDKELVNSCLYDDCSIISQLSDTCEIGIFSKGDEAWQKQKINSFEGNIKNENVYIFPDKLSNAKSVFDKYKGASIFLVDNDSGVLKAISELNIGVQSILIDRQGDLEDNVGVKKIKSLNDLINLI